MLSLISWQCCGSVSHPCMGRHWGLSEERRRRSRRRRRRHRRGGGGEERNTHNSWLLWTEGSNSHSSQFVSRQSFPQHPNLRLLRWPYRVPCYPVSFTSDSVKLGGFVAQNHLWKWNPCPSKAGEKESQHNFLLFKWAQPTSYKDKDTTTIMTLITAYSFPLLEGSGECTTTMKVPNH